MNYPSRNNVPLQPHEHELLSKYDEFLALELARVRNLPDNQPDAQGEHTELVRNLLVALERTKGGNFMLSLERVYYFLHRHAPELRLPAYLGGGWSAMKSMREKRAAYVVDESQRETPAKQWWQFW